MVIGSAQDNAQDKTMRRNRQPLRIILSVVAGMDQSIRNKLRNIVTQCRRLFHALVNDIEPKIRLEASCLESLRSENLSPAIYNP